MMNLLYETHVCLEVANLSVYSQITTTATLRNYSSRNNIHACKQAGFSRDLQKFLWHKQFMYFKARIRLHIRFTYDYCIIHFNKEWQFPRSMYVCKPYGRRIPQNNERSDKQTMFKNVETTKQT